MKRLLLAVIALALALLLLLNVRLHRPGGPGTVDAQLRYLEGALGDQAGERMQQLFPEGYDFTWALYGLASAQRAATLDPDGPRRAHLLAETRRALAAMHSEKARSVFVEDMEPAYGAFHRSWTLYLLAEYVRAAGPENLPPETVETFTRECDRFVRALEAYGSPFMESYPDQVWPADTAPGIAALGIHDQVVGPRYGETIRRWVAEARTRLDPRLGALTHEADSITGAPRGGVRGESLALMSRLLVDADPAFAREQYAILREHFLQDVAGLPGFREYPPGVEEREDVDSGPIIAGFSGPAVVVGAAAARVHGDLEVADAVMGAVELVGMPVQLGGRRVYAFGELPIGDAFIAWTNSSPARVSTGEDWGARPAGWFWPIHAVSVVVAALLLVWAVRIVGLRERWLRGRASGDRGPTAGSTT